MENMQASIANEIRGLCLDMIATANSGHLGLPLGCAECGTVLFGQFLRYLPKNPRWINRDRFILSAGHGSALLYACLHLCGYDISLEDLKQFRQLRSKTPGHPEFGLTPGIEATTGPLGQGIGNAVGIAVSQKKLAEQLNTSTHTIIDNCVVCLCGEGCLQEGVGLESITLAGLWKLNNLILIYDCNQVTLDTNASVSQNEDTRSKFEALGWNVHEVNGQDPTAILQALEQGRTSNDKPTLIILKTIIGYGLSISGTSKAHGAAGIKEIVQVKQTLGLDPNKSFFISDTTKKFFEKHKLHLQKNYNNWVKIFEDWCETYPEKASFLIAKNVYKDLEPSLEKNSISTRECAGKYLNYLAQKNPHLLTGSADVFESVKNYLHACGDFSVQTIAGRNLFFGIREHAMGSVLNGIAYDGFFQPSGSTFLAFSDYLKPALRIAALSHLPVWYFFSHDSIAVGEDGPTHQPIEQLVGLRSIPNIQVLRPADSDELWSAFQCAIQFKEGPSIFILSRQTLNYLDTIPQNDKLRGSERGAYIIRSETEPLKTLIIATGSEVELALKTANLLGTGTRVVSMPSCEIFLHQEAEYQEKVLPSTCKKRIAIEAASSLSWHRFVGSNGLVIGIDRFGISAPAASIFNTFHLTPELCAQKIKAHESLSS